jgi:tetratricopeptide (TPR) repeat protein
MIITHKLRYLTLAFCISLIFSLTLCNPKKNKEIAEYWNHGDSVSYVGIQTCAQCHQDIYETFSHTGMGLSYEHAHRGKSIADFENHPPVFDSILDFFYRALWKNDRLVIEEFRIENGDTTHLIQQEIDFIIGSGQHTQSNIFHINNHYFQAPLTWYAQKAKADLPPGYEDGANSRFSRIIGLECMSCHNAMPTGFVMGSENKFQNLPEGIDCERCHGPGSAHVAKIQGGDITDTSKYIDYSIVNPKKLTAQLGFEICQRCHLQGNAVLHINKSFFDFRPGMILNQVMDVYLPRYENDQSFIMASHVDRFKQSKCYQSAPESFVCTSCHNPHISVKVTGKQAFNNSCVNCHQNPEECSAPALERQEVENNCVGCHMPVSGSSDIPHVRVHDHYIRKNYNSTSSKEKIFAGLVAINNPQPDLRSRIYAYLQQFERFDSQGYLLDSARTLLLKAGKDQYPEAWIHYHYLQQSFAELVTYQRTHITKSKLHLQSYDNLHAWTAFRIAEAYNQTGQIEESLNYIEKAIELAPFIPEFHAKAAVICIKNKKYNQAEKHFREIEKEMGYDPAVWNNRGFLEEVKGDEQMAKKAYLSAIAADPNYPSAYFKLAGLHIRNNEFQPALDWLEKANKIIPNNPEIQQGILWLKEQIQ